MRTNPVHRMVGVDKWVTSMKRFDVSAAWDAEAKIWWGGNDELPFSTEAPTLAQFEARAAEIGQEMAEINGLVAPGERVQIRTTEKATK